MKKVLALALATIMVLALCGAAFAATPNNTINPGANTGSGISPTREEPGEFKGGAFSETPEDKIYATGIEDGDSVDYYQLVAWNGNTIGTSEANGVHGWILTTKGKLLVGSGENDIAATEVGVLNALLDGINVTEAGKIAASMTETTKDGTMSATSTAGKKEATVAAGLYYLKANADASTTTIYNPAFVSADHYADNNSVAFSESSTIGSSSTVKKSQITLEKSVVGNSSTYTDATSYNDVNSGDIIPFQVTTKIPVYEPKTYDAAVFSLFDKLDTGLELFADATHKFTVSYGSTTKEYTSIENANETDYTLNVTTGDAGSYTLAYKFDYLTNADRGVVNVTVTYYAKVNTNAINYNVIERDNTVTLTFSHSPTETQDLHDRTRHYTFAIDGDAFGIPGTKTSELIKVGLSEDGTVITMSSVTYRDGSVQSPLAGAKFKLTGISASNSDIERECTTAADGRIHFEDLDAGDYTLEEIEAPNGYVKDGRTYTIKIIPTYEADGVDPANPDSTPETDVLKKYEIKILYGGTEVGQATFTATMERQYYSEELKVASSEDQSNFVANRQGNELPSTGGIGTTIFYVTGLIMVVGAAAILVARRRADAE